MKKTWNKKTRKIIKRTDHALVELSNGSFCKIDLEDVDKIKLWNWTFSNGYAMRGLSLGKGKTKNLKMHRFLIKAKLNQIVDHINRDTLDNRKRNLRIVDDAQNCQNRRGQNHKKYKGVSYRKDRGTWLAYIRHNGKLIKIGTYKTPELAAAAYNKKAKEIFGKYAFLNKIIIDTR